MTSRGAADPHDRAEGVGRRIDINVASGDSGEKAAQRLMRPRLDVVAVVAQVATMDVFMDAAIEEARQGLAEGGIPIGAVLVVDGRVVGRGHNRRVQQGSAVLHAEMDCLERAGRLRVTEYRRATLYTTLSPCDMCSGAALLYGIPRIVIGENRTFRGPESYLVERGVALTVADDPRCIQLMREFIAEHSELWLEDIGG